VGAPQHRTPFIPLLKGQSQYGQRLGQADRAARAWKEREKGAWIGREARDEEGAWIGHEARDEKGA